MGRDKYILDSEIELLYDHLDPSSVLMIYQHLPNNKHVHEVSVTKKIKQLRSSNKDSHVCGYREDEVVFLFMSKDATLFTHLSSTLTNYHSKSEHRYKSLHLLPDKRLHSDSLQPSASGFRPPVRLEPFSKNEPPNLKEDIMPTISMFFGIIIRIFYRDATAPRSPYSR